MAQELAYEKHNRIAGEMGQRIVQEFDFIDQLLVLESLVSAVICLMFKKESDRVKAVGLHSDGVLVRIRENTEKGL